MTNNNRTAYDILTDWATHCTREARRYRAMAADPSYKPVARERFARDAEQYRMNAIISLNEARHHRLSHGTRYRVHNRRVSRALSYRVEAAHLEGRDDDVIRLSLMRDMCDGLGAWSFVPA